jgi:iron complex outermembrane receptor protein
VNERKIKYGLLLLLFSAESLVAQSVRDTIRIGEVSVFGKRKAEEAGLMQTKVDTLILKALQTLDISELLSAHSPVFIKSYGRGSAASASFRGTAPSHTQVVWNGMNVNSPMRGDVDFSMFPVHFIDDLQLLHGGSSLAAGPGALGGSILIENKPDWGNRLNLRYGQTVESFGTYKEFIRLMAGTEKFQSKTRLFFDRSDNDFPYYNYGVLPRRDDIQKNAAYRKQGILQEVYGRLGQKHFLSVKGWFYKSGRDLPQLMSFEGAHRNETQNDRNMRVVADWKWYAEKYQLKTIAGFSNNRLHYFRSSTEANFVNFDSDSRENVFAQQTSFDWKPNERLSFRWSLGNTFNKVKIYDRALQTGYNESRFESSLLNSARAILSRKLAASFLFRSEFYDKKLIAFIPSVGVDYDFDETSGFKINLSRNYHQPNLNDLYWLPGGNPELKPEDGLSSDLAFRKKWITRASAFDLKLTGFASLIDHWIIWRPAANGAYYWEAANLKKVFSRGAEITSSWRYRPNEKLKLAVDANYSYTRSTNENAVESVDQSRGKQLIYIPKHKGNVFAQLDYRNWHVKASAPFTGKRYTTSDNNEPAYEEVLTPYWLLHLTVGKKFLMKGFDADVSLRTENIFDTDYMAILWRPMPGRYYSLNLQIEWKR